MNQPCSASLSSWNPSIYRGRRKLEEAAELGRRVLGLRKSTLEKNHPDILIGITNLTLTYHKQGCFVEMRETLPSSEEPQLSTVSSILTVASIPSVLTAPSFSRRSMIMGILVEFLILIILVAGYYW